MIEVKLNNNLTRSTAIVDENKTVRQVLEEAGWDLNVGQTMMDGGILRAEDMNKTLAELGVTETCRISKVAKQDNAVTVDIVGSVAVIESSLTPEQIKTAEKYRPDALTVVNKDDEPVFRVGTTNTQEGAINKFGASFGVATSTEGFATITVPWDNGGDAVDRFVDKFGGALNFIKKLEDNVISQLEDIAEENAAVRSMIARA